MICVYMHQLHDVYVHVTRMKHAGCQGHEQAVNGTVGPGRCIGLSVATPWSAGKLLMPVHAKASCRCLEASSYYCEDGGLLFLAVEAVATAFEVVQ